jgi:hypothetical protein
VKWWGKSPPVFLKRKMQGKPHQEQGQAADEFLVLILRVDRYSIFGNDYVR